MFDATSKKLNEIRFCMVYWGYSLCMAKAGQEYWGDDTADKSGDSILIPKHD